MKIVQVKDIPVRYANTTYQPGSSFEMEDEHVNEKLVKVMSDVENALKTIEEMTVAELEAYALEKEIDISECANKAEKLAKIKEIESGE